MSSAFVYLFPFFQNMVIHRGPGHQFHFNERLRAMDYLNHIYSHAKIPLHNFTGKGIEIIHCNSAPTAVA